jgi:hypothetical protein
MTLIIRRTNLYCQVICFQGFTPILSLHRHSATPSLSHFPLLNRPLISTCNYNVTREYRGAQWIVIQEFKKA